MIHELSQGLLYPIFNKYRALASTSAGPHLSSWGKRRETGRDSGTKGGQTHLYSQTHTRDTPRQTHPNGHTHTATLTDRQTQNHTSTDTQTHTLTPQTDTLKDTHTESPTQCDKQCDKQFESQTEQDRDLSFGNFVQYIVEGCKEHVMNELWAPWISLMKTFQLVLLEFVFYLSSLK